MSESDLLSARAEIRRLRERAIDLESAVAHATQLASDVDADRDGALHAAEAEAGRLRFALQDALAGLDAVAMRVRAALDMLDRG